MMTITATIQSRRQGAMACGLAIIAAAAGAPLLAEEKVPEVTHDGLHLVPDSKVAIAWVRPDAELDGYDKFMIGEVEVAFRQNWLRDHKRQNIYSVTPKDMEKIKQAAAELFREVFVRELEADGGYPVVDAADAGVLRLRPAMVDLDVAAPDTGRQPGRMRTFVTSAGSAALFLEIYDSVSGEILARVLDRQAARGAGHVMHYADKVTNRNEAEKILAGWAGLLRRRFDEIHGKSEE